MGSESGEGEAYRDAMRRVAIWDLPTRLFHWTLVVLFVVLWITGTRGPLDLHMAVGEVVLAMLAFRVAWGFFGSRHSRFADFVVGAREARAHLAEIFAVAIHGPQAARGGAPHAGHTRLGGWMILALLALMALEATTGLFATDDIMTEGPLNHLVSGAAGRFLTMIHSGAFNVLMTLIVVHVAAAFFYLIRKRENLIVPLISGRARLPAEAAALEGKLASPWRALLLLAAAAGLVWGIISL